MIATPRTLVDVLENLQHAPATHQLTLVDARGAEVTYSWRDVHRRIRLHAAHLASQGIGWGDRVLVCPTNQPDVLLSFLGLFYLGAVPLSVSGANLGQAAGSQLPRLAELVQQTGAKGVFTQAELLAGNDEKELIPPGLQVEFMPTSLELGEELDVDPAEVSLDDLAFVQFSSGSTSRPKGVRISHRNVIENTRLLVESGRRHTNESGCSWLPLYHDMGLLATLLATLRVQSRQMTILHPVRFLMRPLSWLETISRTRARISVCPNFALDLCVERIAEQQLREAKIDLSSIEMIFVGAEPVRPNSVRRFTERFGRHGLAERTIYPVYGMAETTLIVTAPEPREEIVTRTVDLLDVPSVGRPLGDFQVQIVDEAGMALPAGCIGEIWIKGTSVTKGYLDTQANEELFRDGWLRSGDLGMLDAEGRLYITGRLKDLMIFDGKNYYAHDIVADLEELPFVERGKVHVFSIEVGGREQMIVLTVPVGRMTPMVRAKMLLFSQFLEIGGPQGWLKGAAVDQLEDYVEKLISSDRAELTNEIKRYVLARFGVPVHDVVFVRRIPRTSSGKVKRDVAEQLYFENRS